MAYNPFGVKTKRIACEFSDKQHFLNTVCERFFQGCSVKTADTHGIVYTPQPIADFLCASVEEVLKSEFGPTLGSPGVNILDPCTGTFRRGDFLSLPRRFCRIPPSVIATIAAVLVFTPKGLYSTAQGSRFAHPGKLVTPAALLPRRGYTTRSPNHVARRLNVAP